MKQNVRDFFTTMLVGNKGTLKGGGGSTTTPPPLKFFCGKVKKRYKEDEKWMGREVVVHVNIFSRGDIFSGGFEIFSGGGVEKFSRGSHVGKTQTPSPPPPPEIYYYCLKTEEVQKNGWGMIAYLLTYFSRLRFFRERLRFSCVGLRYFQGGFRNFQRGLLNLFRRGE